MNTVRKALGFSFLSQYLLQVVQFAVVIVLSRLLTPSEIGVFSVAAVSLFLAVELRNFGVTQFIVRIEELTPARLAAAKGFAVLTSWSIALVFFLGADAIAAFFSEPGLAQVYDIVALNFVFMPLIIVPHAYLVRSMAFDRVMVIGLAGNLVRGAVSVALAYVGFGYMSLAWGYLIGGIAEVGTTILLRQDRPSKISFRGMSEIFKFGIWSTGAGFLSRGYEGIPDLLLGRLSTMEAVGIYSRATSLVLMFHRLVTKAIESVVLPYFSKVLRDGDSVREGFLHSVSLQTALAWPFFAVLFFVVDPLLLLLFGEQWVNAGPVAKILCVWGAMYSVYSMIGRVLIAQGFIRLYFGQQMFMLLFRGLAIAATIVHGLSIVALAVSLSSVLEFLFSSYLLKKTSGVGAAEILRNTVLSWIPTLACGLVAWFCVDGLVDTLPNANVRLIVCVVLTSVTWLAGIFVVKHPVSKEVSYLIASGVGKFQAYTVKR